MLLASATIDIDADQRTVFDLFTSEDGLCRWMAKEASVDLRPGGAFRWVHDNGVAAAGTYVDVDPYEHVRFTYGWESGPYADMGPGTSTVDVRFDTVGGSTRVTVEHSGVPAEFVDAHQGGWSYFLGLLADIARGSAVPETRLPNRGG